MLSVHAFSHSLAPIADFSPEQVKLWLSSRYDWRLFDQEAWKNINGRDLIALTEESLRPMVKDPEVARDIKAAVGYEVLLTEGALSVRAVLLCVGQLFAFLACTESLDSLGFVHAPLVDLDPLQILQRLPKMPQWEKAY
jgi:hypothetical protein